MERDLGKRWCAFHDPVFARPREEKRVKVLFLKSTCKVKMPSRRRLCLPPVYLWADTWIALGSVVRCRFGGRLCFDRDRRWRRIRCREEVGKSRTDVPFPPVGIIVERCVLCDGAGPTDIDNVLCFDCC